MRRMIYHAIACCIILPIMPFYILSVGGDAVSRVADRMIQGRRWTLWIFNIVSRLEAWSLQGADK